MNLISKWNVSKRVDWHPFTNNWHFALCKKCSNIWLGFNFVSILDSLGLWLVGRFGGNSPTDVWTSKWRFDTLQGVNWHLGDRSIWWVLTGNVLFCLHLKLLFSWVLHFPNHSSSIFVPFQKVFLRVNNCVQSSTVKDNFVLLKQSNKTHEETSTGLAIIMPNRLVLPT